MPLFEKQTQLESNQINRLVGRESHLSEWEQRLLWEPNMPSQVLVYTGSTGVGKSALCIMAIEKLLKEFNVPYALINFELDIDSNTPEKVFMQIRRQLKKFGIVLPTFDYVWGRHWELNNGQSITKSVLPDGFEDISEIISTVLGIINIKSILNLGKDVIDFLSKEQRELALKVKEMDSAELLSFMPHAIAIDIANAVLKKENRGKNGNYRITIIFDSFEKLKKDEFGDNDWWIREFCLECGPALKVILGWKKLDWIEKDNQWKKWIYNHSPLNNLSFKQSEDLLIKFNILDPDLRKFLYKITKGFPLHLELAALRCNLISSQGDTPSEDDFSYSEETQDLSKNLFRRIVKGLKEDEKDGLEIASIPSWFTKEIFNSLWDKTSSEDRIFTKIISFPFCLSIPNIPGAYMFRREIRKMLNEKKRSSKSIEKLQSTLFSSYLEASKLVAEEFSEEIALNFEREAIKVAEKLNDKTKIAASYLHMAGTLIRVHHFSEALINLENAYKAAEHSGDKKLIAECLLFNAGIETSLNPDYGDFLLINKAVTLYRELGDKIGEIGALHTKVILALHLRQFDHLKEPLELAEVLSKDVDDKYLFAVTIQLRGEYLALTNQWEKAIITFEVAKESFELIRESIQRRIGICAATGWKGLSLCHTGRNEEGIAFVHQALKMEREVLMSREGVAKWLHYLGEMYYKKKNYAEALSVLLLSKIIREELKHSELKITQKIIKEIKEIIGNIEYLKIRNSQLLSDFHKYTFLLGLGPFTKYKNNPILSPQGKGWESHSVFNPSTVVSDDEVIMLYRAEEIRKGQENKYRSSIGFAKSSDGINFIREPNPIITPTELYEIPGGCEDPRIVKLENKYFLTYTAYDDKIARLAMATSNDLRNWHKEGKMFEDSQWDNYFPKSIFPDTPRGWTKSGVIIPHMINDRYWMYFGDTYIWIASTDNPDLKDWEINKEPVLKTRINHFDSLLVEPGPPVLILPEGIWLGYNGKDKNQRYSFGQAIFSIEDPTKLIHRSTFPLLEPNTKDEIHGQVSSVVFGQGLVRFKDKIFLYYGMADSKIGVAFADDRLLKK